MIPPQFKSYTVRVSITLAINMIRYVIVAFALLSQAAAQNCSKVVIDYRRAIVHIRVEKTHKITGAIDIVEGTGFIVQSDGYLVTNNHVVAKEADIDKVEITGAIASRVGFRTPILTITNDDQHDLALLQLENSSEVYQSVLIGEPWSVSPSSNLCSLGFPSGQEFHYSNGTLGGKAATKGWWSTDMPSNRGESGAPVFADATGRVVAIKVGGYDDAQNLNLVIPINLAGSLLSQVPHLSELPSATQPSNSRPATLPSGNVTVYNGFRNYGQSVFNFAQQKIDPWGSQNADLGVANPTGERTLAQFFINNDAPPYTDPSSINHPIENAGIREMGTSNLDEVKQCPTSDYKMHYFQPQLDHVYCVRTRDGRHWAKIKVTVIAPDRIAFDYVYQPSGSPTF